MPTFAEMFSFISSNYFPRKTKLIIRQKENDVKNLFGSPDIAVSVNIWYFKTINCTQLKLRSRIFSLSVTFTISFYHILMESLYNSSNTE